MSTGLVYLDGLGVINTLHISFLPCCLYHSLCHAILAPESVLLLAGHYANSSRQSRPQQGSI